MNTNHYNSVEKLVKFVQKKIKSCPTVAVICGSGLGGLADAIENKITIPYSDIPNFPQTSVKGHRGNLIFGNVGNKYVVAMQGRFHMYEGYTNAQISTVIRLLKLLGVQYLLISNAAGGINRKYKVGDCVIIKDHISFPSLSLQNVLIGPNDERFGPRFPATSDAYDYGLRQKMFKVMQEKNLPHMFKEGVYAGLGGPSYETPAECRMLEIIGADVVGMSTVPEVLVARHAGMKVFAMSLVTNMAQFDVDSPAVVNHEEVLHAASQKADLIKDIFCELICQI